MIPIPMIFCCQIMLSVLSKTPHDGAGVEGEDVYMCTVCTLIWSWGIGTRTLSLQLLVRGNGHVDHVTRLDSDTWESSREPCLTRSNSAPLRRSQKVQELSVKYFAVSQLALVCRLMCDLVHCIGIVVEMLIHQLFILLGHLIEYYGWVWSAHDSNWRGWFISQINFL